MPRKLALATAGVLTCLSGVHSTEPGCPGSIQWDGGGGTTAWTTLVNWSSNAMPGTGDDVCIPELATGVEVVHSTGTHAIHSLAGPGGLQVSGGTLSFAVDSPGIAQLTVSGGTLSGTGDLPVSGPFAWSAGTMTGAGTTSVANATINGSSFKDLGGGRALQTTGTTTWLAPGTLRLNGGASIRADGMFNMGDAAMTTPDGTGSLVIPVGATLKKAGAGTGTLAVPMNIAGTLAVQSGTLTLAAGSSLTGGIQGSANGTLEFSAGANALLEGSSLSVGAVVVSGGSLTVDGTYSATSSTFYGGTMSFRPASVVSGAWALTLSGAAVVDFSSGALVQITRLYMTGGTLQGSDRIIESSSSIAAYWAGGEMRGPGVTWLNAPQLWVDGPASKDLTGGRGLSTDNLVTWSGTGPIRVGAGAYILARWDWMLQSDASIVDLGGAEGFLFEGGEFRKMGGNGTSVVGIPFFLISGIVRVSSGTLEFTAGYTQTAGTTQLDGGTLAATVPLAIQGGSLRGVGTVLADVDSAGTVSPGLIPPSPPVGLLTIDGIYGQAPAGTLAVEIGGLGAGSQYDRLDVTGAVSLGGTLSATLINGFVPQDGDTFTILTSPDITGAFSIRSLPSLGGGLGWLVHVEPTDVVLEVAPDADGDTFADAGDCAPADATAHSLPTEAAALVFAADRQTLSWASQAASAGSGTVYDAVRGVVASLPVGGFGESCVLASGATPQLVDATPPDPGTGFYYLVRARNACGVASYGEETGGTPRATSACP